MTRDWTAYHTWYDLLDALCNELGYHDNLALAEALCSASGIKTQAAFDTAVKNLRNWRQGIHIPQRKNLMLLANVLKVDHHEGLRTQWNHLYGLAKVKPSSGTGDVVGEAEKNTHKSRWPLLTTGIVAGVLGVMAFQMTYGQKESPSDPVASYEGIIAEYVRNISIKVGESAIIHGARGNECGDAPTWESAKLLLPELVTGTLTDGGVGTRVSRQCGGRIPARAILFTATSPGTEQISLYGDDIVIRVTD